jgi:hypothetical protein
MDPQARHRLLAVLGLVDGPPRSVTRHATHNQKDHAGDRTPNVGSALDKLKLAGRIDLDDGEELLSSGKLDADNGAVRVAHTRRGGQPSLRFAAEAYGGEGMPKWSGNRPRTAELQAERERLDAERDQLDEDDPRYDELTEQLDTLGEGDDWSTARLDAARAEEFRTRLRAALAGAAEAEKAENKRYDEIDRLERERDKLRGDPTRKWTAEEEAWWDSLTEQIETLESGTAVGFAEFDEEGVVAGEWSDIHYHVYFEDFEEVDSGTTALIGVKPHGVEPDWELARDWKGVFKAADMRKILKLLDPPDVAASRSRALRLRAAAGFAGAVT